MKVAPAVTGMRPKQNKIFPVLAITLCLLVTVFTQPALTQSTELEQQREKFIQARNALSQKNLGTFKLLTEELRDYPLYPYLIYYFLSDNLDRVKEDDIRLFLDRYGDLTTANDLRRDWLRYLARRHRWESYIEHYKPQSDKTLQCYHLHARVMAGKQEYLLEDARTIWLSGESLPSQCDSAFKLLYQSDLMTNELVWQRIQLAMAERDTSLAKYLGRYLDDEHSQWLDRWIAIHNNPARFTRQPGYDDIPVAREILLHGIYRLARQDTELAIGRWEELMQDYSFNEEEIASVQRYLTIRAASSELASSQQMLEEIPNELVDDDIFHWRLLTALRDHDWQRLYDWTTGEPPESTLKQRWLYWHGRALLELGRENEAMAVFNGLSSERDYYGFLATDRLNKSYDMGHRALPEDLETWQKIQQRPAIQRARELFILGMHYAARREWLHSYKSMTSYQLQIAAAIASNWGWHDQAISAMGRARAYDDLVTRFPMPYQKIIKANAEYRNLDQSWVYALTRAESTFMEDARSPAGALGLMQVMPATGRETARAIRFDNFYTGQLLKAETNIPIGTEYLRKMYDEYNQNIILATAAYNAGPTAVKRWLPAAGCIDPEIWIEQIPYRETRRYVTRILYYASIYDWRMRQEIKPVRQRMAAIVPRNNSMVASLACTSQALSYNID